MFHRDTCGNEAQQYRGSGPSREALAVVCRVNNGRGLFKRSGAVVVTPLSICSNVKGCRPTCPHRLRMAVAVWEVVPHAMVMQEVVPLVVAVREIFTAAMAVREIVKRVLTV